MFKTLDNAPILGIFIRLSFEVASFVVDRFEWLQPAENVDSLLLNLTVQLNDGS